MGWKLSPGISFCWAGDDLVFLDLRTDRYFQLAPRDRQLFERLCHQEAADADLARFAAADIVRRIDGVSDLAPAHPTLAPDDIYGLEQPKASLRGAVEVGFHVVRSRAAIRSVRLARTIAELSRQKARADVLADAAILATAMRFDANRSIVPIARRCLIDSVALARMLLGRGLAADLIFGIRTGPFAAHCWLQAGEHILTCPHDEARNFTPILVI